ncbi:hypothetical protein AGDE_14031 [Angomonas deanei]|uniref:Uncharacterized protein n=1 Tax=Angomonas deanei TaxID=59799 RepID=A0A7G2CSZ9_9TRYP|nr:hypothetical protein AGDE_14031 [Angomonas deanei]CAD2222910.1 hypothetical protein, conserved [Angomonas deanei]|eukprot:EPY21509.1 hypothetical protein AGDE_14031 [Angomonas deanei]
MKKFVNNVKSVVGTIDHTKDEEADKLSERLKTVYTIPSDIKSATSSMKSTVDTVVNSLERVAKAYAKVGEEEGAAAESKKLAEEITAAVKKIKDEAACTYKKALESDEIALKKLHDAVAEVRKLESDRKSKLNKYDVARVTVEQKEKEYEKKGKDISDSKKYEEEVASRDKHKKEYDEVNQSFKEKGEELLKMKDAEYMTSMREWSKTTIAFIKAIDTQLESVKP